MNVGELIETLKLEDPKREIMIANIRFRDHDRVIVSGHSVRQSKAVIEKIKKDRTKFVETGEKNG